MKQIPRKAIDAILKECQESPYEEMMVKKQFIIDALTEIKKLRYIASKPRYIASKPHKKIELDEEFL